MGKPFPQALPRRRRAKKDFSFPSVELQGYKSGEGGGKGVVVWRRAVRGKGECNFPLAADWRYEGERKGGGEWLKRSEGRMK